MNKRLINKIKREMIRENDVYRRVGEPKRMTAGLLVITGLIATIAIVMITKSTST